MSVTVNRNGRIKCACSICGAPVWRKYNKTNLSCAECKSKRKAEYAEKQKHQPKKPMGRPPKYTPKCERCDYIGLCKQDLHVVALVPGEGLIIMPLRCFKDHPAYDASEWEMRRQEARA